ncbi:MAG TPA: 6-carboxytetrahydropterin synthase [Burkholderiales bacterium]|nr:6-carboxytetrahydropterin synthase [Burkholderiales bacterium]
MRITRRLEFDSGHRIPNHRSRCRHLHGHRYALEVTLTGPVVATPGDPREGMVLDFSEVKAIARRVVVDVWDHAFLAWREDQAVLDFLATIPDHRTVVFAAPPTAEHLAEAAFRLLEPAYRAEFGNALTLECVRLYETPNCWADALRSEL